jgi:hypothetical protein
VPHITQYKDIRLIDVDSLIEELEDLVEEDNHAYCLENKSKLIKSFVVLRLCNLLFTIIENNKKFKLLYLINKKAKLSLLQPYYNFIYTTFVKISKILAITYFIDDKEFKDYQFLLAGNSGESKEIHVKLYKVFNRVNKTPNFGKLKSLLEGYNITSSKILDNTFNVKLGLFLT